MHLPGGILADKYGGRHVLSLGVLASAFITVITPAIIQNLSWHWLVVSRFLLGFAQAPMYPSITALLAHWVPARQRSRLGSLVYSGIQVGIVTGLLFSGLMIDFFGNWPVIFYVWGGLCFMWYGFFLVMCFSKPSSHPFITDKEKQMLNNEFGVTQRFRTPWKTMLKDSAVWALIGAQFGHDWITYLVEVDMPKYFKNVLKMNVADNALITSVPFAAMWFCSNLTGYLSDYIINKHNIKIVTMRIIYTTISSAGPSTLVLLATYMGCNSTLVVVFFWVGMISMGPYYPGLKVNVLDLTINFSGVLMSLANGIGVLTGIAVPYLVAKIAENQSMHQWQNVFWVTFVVCTVTNIIYIIWASGERRKWDYSPEVIPPPEETME
ncbi:hypothetical protein ILUMI_02771 [Ignelater luminosus]|uniref:Major facilitator superfamily (MFS) profile domain-containing protein n=1 Tax=Ignelater luminosus TaxID=2038154 RepID=A0A8K0GMV9_IGNLU|nr:hypothetical protein ILUMI_02771 [Ignelater luminosus]